MESVENKKPDERLGAYLARMREASSMTIADLAIATKLSEKNITLIERGDWNAFPVKAYLRGYLNSISNKLGLDSKRVMDWYFAESGSKFVSLLSDKPTEGKSSATSIVDSEKESSSEFKYIVIILIVILIGFVLASRFLTNEKKESLVEKTVPVVSDEIEPETEVQEMPEGAESIPVDSASVSEDSTAVKEEVQKEELPISQAEVDSVVKSSSLPESATIFISSTSSKKEENKTAEKQTTKFELVASGETRSWVGIKQSEADTTFLKEANLSKIGTKMVYTSDDSLYIVIGEPRAIAKIILNGVEKEMPVAKFGRVTRFSVYGGEIIPQGAH